MPVEDDVLKVGKKLEKMISTKTVDHSSAMDLLKNLQDLPMNLEVLQKTRIGMTVNNFRKASSSEEVVNLSKLLIKNWKKLLPAGDNNSSKTDMKKEKSNSDKNGEESSTTPGEIKRSPSFTPDTASVTSDPVRLKCRELLANALIVEEETPGMRDKIELAAEIEDQIYLEFNRVDTKYKNRVRSRVANLKDVKNPSLRENVRNGLIQPDQISKMSADEMASDAMKELRTKYTKKGIDDHQLAKTSGTNTGLFRCSKCGKKNCTYNQVQTRSADEPMTTFVLCNECGKRWKFC